MMLYRIVLFLMIFGAVTSCISEIGIVPVKLPDRQVGITEAQISDLNEQAFGSDLGAISWFTIPFMVLRILFGAMLAVVTILPIMISYGVPLLWGMMVQTPVWLVEAFGLYQAVSGHGAKGFE